MVVGWSVLMNDLSIFCVFPEACYEWFLYHLEDFFGAFGSLKYFVDRGKRKILTRVTEIDFIYQFERKLCIIDTALY